jgi:hypothetical protein
MLCFKLHRAHISKRREHRFDVPPLSVEREGRPRIDAPRSPESRTDRLRPHRRGAE